MLGQLTPYFQAVVLVISVIIYPKNLSGQGFEIYLVKTGSPDLTSKKDCYYCFNPTVHDLFDNPLLVESDLYHFDWQNQQIKLTDEGLEKIKRLKIPLHGLAASMVVDGQPIYGFWLWNSSSSFGCDRVFTYPMQDFKLKFGLPDGHSKGEDPRYNSSLQQCLTKSGLLR